ncbi:MAG: amino acid permease, partial [SAR324 cluster bacterium]|nr:amino acid permease [SAR324 cluster bacterium]
MNGNSKTKDSNGPVRTTRVVIATTVALTFISFWRASAVVLSDLASTMFYAGGIAEQAIGKSAAWFIIGVMLFGFAIRSVYMESCSMFVRGGVYVVVRDAMGPVMAKLSVSALIFDYLITGPISSVSAGHYIGGLINEISELAHWGFVIPRGPTAVLLALCITIYFWHSNIKGIHESSHKALRIMQLTTIMVVILLIWCPLTLI